MCVFVIISAIVAAFAVGVTVRLVGNAKGVTDIAVALLASGVLLFGAAFYIIMMAAVFQIENFFNI